MWPKLERWLQPRASDSAAVSRELALAVLMVEAARADHDHQAAELQTIRSTLQHALQLPQPEAERLLQQALARSEASISLYEFISTLNRELDAPGKEELLLWLWQVAHADGHVDVQEEALIRRVADLLYVSHSVFVRSRLQAGTQRPH
jgi:uncharacterized tellurite resistance protein B-like protein